jgi:UDP-N-acetyl-D-mannosaminuronic acid dehydrogenase
VLDKVRAAVEARTAGGRPARELQVAVLGLAFKPNIDDLRESPALHIAEAMARELPCRLLVVEPHVETLPRELEGQALVDARQAVAEADIVVLLVAHQQFTGLSQWKRPAGQVLVDVVGLTERA